MEPLLRMCQNDSMISGYWHPHCPKGWDFGTRPTTLILGKDGDLRCSFAYRITDVLPGSNSVVRNGKSTADIAILPPAKHELQFTLIQPLQPGKQLGPLIWPWICRDNAPVLRIMGATSNTVLSSLKKTQAAVGKSPRLNACDLRWMDEQVIAEKK